jgi:hypothetical protein
LAILAVSLQGGPSSWSHLYQTLRFMTEAGEGIVAGQFFSSRVAPSGEQSELVVDAKQDSCLGAGRGNAAAIT